ncbi:MAG: bile acid:sodium symporter family protein [Candidatus Nanohaloarchaea archaeon]
MFSALIASLFFLIGLHLKIDKLRSCRHRLKELGIGLSVIFVLTPLLGFLIDSVVGGALGDAFLVIGVSAAALGSPVVFANRGRAEGELSLIIGGVSVILGVLLMPLLLSLFGLDVVFQDLALKNLAVVGVPLVAGIGAQRWENFLLDDLRHHFSKLSLWLIVTIMGVQGYLVYSAQGLQFLTGLGTALVLMTGFVSVSYGLGYGISRLSGLLEKNSRSVGFSSGSKNLALALFMASQVGGEVVAYVLAYYFVRQAVTGGISEAYRRNLFPWN